MFKKLRQKVENATDSPEKDGSSPPSVRRQSLPMRRQLESSGKRRNQSTMPKTGSSTSLSGSEADMVTESSSKEDLLAALMQRTTQVKRLEIKLADYGQSLKECTKQRDKLVTTLEKQQDTAMRRMTELEETYSEGKTKMEATIISLEKQERDLAETVDKLRTENKKLQSSVSEWEEEKEEFRKNRDEFFAKRDNSEELQDLQKQELAKVKHMLMNSEKEAKRLQEELDEKVGELIQTREANDELESNLRCTTSTLNSLRKELEERIEECEEMNKSKQTQEETTAQLRRENSEAKDRISTLFTDLKKTRSSLSALESTHSSVCEKYQGLKHSSEAIMTKATTQLDEQESIIDHLKKKIATLEQRVTTDSLPENEQVQALLSERSTLENRLEESHQQLNNIKSTWSTKINQLEQQVSHLNAKIAEDAEEHSAKTVQFEELKSSTTKEIEELSSKLLRAQEEFEQSSEQNDAYLEQVTRLEADLIEQSTKYDLERSKSEHNTEKLSNRAMAMEAKLREQIDHLHHEQNEASDKMKLLEDELNRAQEDLTLKEEEIKSRISEFEGEIRAKMLEISSRDRVTEEVARALEETRHSRDQLRDQFKVAESSMREMKGRIKDMDERLQTAGEESSERARLLKEEEEKHSSVKAKLEEVTSELETTRHQLAKRSEHLTHLQSTQSENESQLQKWTKEIEHMKATLESREEELMQCKEEIASLRNDHGEEDEEVSRLKANKASLEEKLADRERSLKLQQQRMNDLKKALNKELNKRMSAGVVNGRSGSLERKTRETMNGSDTVPVVNGTDEAMQEIAVIGTTSIDDPSLSLEQREITVKYLKHVVLTFLSCGQSEAQQLIKAMSMLLGFNREEEQFLKEIIEYRTSWFGSKPKSKKDVKSASRPGRR